MAPLVQVPSPPPRQPRYGLVASVGGEAAIRNFTSNASEGGADRWEAGFTWWPDDCASDTAPFDITCPVDASFDADEMPDHVEFIPYGVWDGVICSTFGGDMTEFQRRATAKLTTSQSHKIEKELWRGDLAQSVAAYSGNKYLAEDGVVDELTGNTLALSLIHI